MKNRVALKLVREGNPKGAKHVIDYFWRRHGLDSNDEAIYRFVRRRTGITIEEWNELLSKVSEGDAA